MNVRFKKKRNKENKWGGKTQNSNLVDRIEANLLYRNKIYPNTIGRKKVLIAKFSE